MFSLLNRDILGYPKTFTKAWVTGFKVRGFGLIVSFYYHPRIRINAAKVFNDMSAWEDLTFESSAICANTINIKLDYRGSSLTDGKCYLIELEGAIN